MAANAASSASTSAEASSGCSSPLPGAGSLSFAAEVAGQPQHPVREARLVAEPAQRLEPGGDPRRPAERAAARDQRLRQPGVVVGERVLEPEPALRRCRSNASERRSTARFEQPAGRLVEPIGIEPREPERHIRIGLNEVGPFRPPTSESSSRCVGLDERGRPRGGEDLAERPDRATDVVADVRLVEPAAVVGHEVAHAWPLVGRVVQERERAVDDRRPELLVGSAPELECHDGEPRDVVDAVAARRFGIAPCACWTIPASSTMVKRWSVRKLAGCGSTLTTDSRRGASSIASRSTRGGRLGDRRPADAAPTRRASARAAREAPGSSMNLQTAAHTAAGSSNGTSSPGAAREHVLGVPERRRDDGAAGGDCERQGSR